MRLRVWELEVVQILEVEKSQVGNQVLGEWSGVRTMDLFER